MMRREEDSEEEWRKEKGVEEGEADNEVFAISGQKCEHMDIFSFISTWFIKRR